MVPRPIVAGALMLAAFLVAVPLARAAEPHPAADPRTEKAREHYLQGDAYYKLDKYASALQEYEQAYVAKSDPSFLYNIAQCHRLMGDKAEALKFYRRYLKDAPTAPNREVAEKHIKDLEAALAAPGGAPPPAPTDAPSGGSIDTSRPPSQDESRPIYTKWWFWTGIGVLVAGGVLTAIALSSGHDPACPTGRICQ